MKLIRLSVTALLLFVGFSAALAQRSNYNEEDIVTMRSQEDVCRNLMALLEEKNVDSALHYFKSKDKTTKATLTQIANEIQKYKGTFTFEVSPDAVSNTENYYYCKYTADEGVTVKYRVDFYFPRADTNFKVTKIVQHKKK